MIIRFFMQAISIILHPLLMATYSCLVLYWGMPELYSPIPTTSIPFFILSMFVLTFVIPALSILLLKGTRKLSNLEMTKREERTLPFFFIAAFYVVTTYLLYSKMNLPKPLFILMTVVSVLITVIFVISIKFKISVHSAGVWGVAGIFSALSIKFLTNQNLIFLLVIFLLSGLTTASRLYLGRHTPEESWFGIFVGFAICFFGVLLFI